MTVLPRPLILLVALLSSLALRAAPLEEQLSAFFAQPRFEGSIWGVKVASLASGRTLFEHGARVRMSPASNCKIYVAALALARLGGDYRIKTPLLATAPVTPTGELPGDFVVSGRGDPSWGSHDGKPEFWPVFAPFVSALQKAGVKHIRGDIVADATWLHCPPDGASWTVDDMSYGYGAEISGVTVFDNEVRIRVSPGTTAGDPCAFELLEQFSNLTIINKTTTLAAGAEKTIDARRIPGSTTVELTGGVAAGGKPELTESPVPRPAQWFATCLREAIIRSGIAVDGVARCRTWPDAPAPASVTIGTIISPPLRDLVTGFMHPSQNLETDLIFAHLGELARTPSTPKDKQSDSLALVALQDFLAKAGVQAGDVVFDEGSGLSRNNLATAAATAQVILFMAKHPEAAAFEASLPLAGREGSLRKRLKGTPAEANLRAKTGTLRWAASLSGNVTNAAGEKLAFSLMLNRYVPPAGRKASAELDEVAVLLARSGSN